MKYIVNYKLFENKNIDDLSEEDKIQLIENNIDELKSNDKDGVISDTVLSKVKSGLTKTLTAATIAILVMLTIQSCSGTRGCDGYGWAQARRDHLK